MTVALWARARPRRPPWDSYARCEKSDKRIPVPKNGKAVDLHSGRPNTDHACMELKTSIQDAKAGR
jgi:hypothetical protein